MDTLVHNMHFGCKGELFAAGFEGEITKTPKHQRPKM